MVLRHPRRTLMRSPTTTAWLLATLCLVVTGAQAHHSWARYDGENVITTAGMLTKVEWASPHVVMQFAVTDDGGASTEWTVEMDPPTLLNRYGLRHDVLAPGMKITITGVPARSGAPMMRAVTITTEDGTAYRVSSRV
jgi:hypothetical protein